jgi:hypothetical protein
MQSSQVIIIYGKNPPAAKIERIRQQCEAEGKCLLVLPFICINDLQALTDKAAELTHEKIVLQKTICSKSHHKYFTEAELEDLKNQVDELEAQIGCLIKKIEES